VKRVRPGASCDTSLGDVDLVVCR